jgi:hypothetical protein
MPLPWQTFKSWEPFRLDALGLVTLLGADEVARAVGTLSPNYLTDFMPLLGAYRIAGNQFAVTEPGYTMYNISDGITNTELSAWFTRWLSQYVSEWVAMDLDLVPHKRSSFDLRTLASFLLGTAAHFMLIAFATVQADWYGVANAAGLLVATLVRNYLIYANLSAYDRKLTIFLRNKKLSDGPKKKKKVLIVRPDGTLVAMYVDIRLLLSLFGRLDPSATEFISLGWHGTYTVVRGIGWLAFVVHIVSIGQATLPSQLLAVGMMTFATVLTIFNVGTQQVPHVLRELRSPKHHEAQQAGHQTFEMGSWVTIKTQPLRQGGTRTKYGQPSGEKLIRTPTAEVSASPAMQSSDIGGKTTNSAAPKPIAPPLRRHMYWLLKLSKTEHERMRHWNLVPLYDAWYQEWYNFLREWTNAREAGGSDDPWNMLERFLGIPSDDMDTGDDTSVEDQLTSTEPEDSGSTRIAPGQALPGASNVDSGPTETTSGA